MKKMSKRFLAVAVSAALCVGSIGTAAAFGSSDEGSGSGKYAADSLYALHESFGVDITMIEEVTVASCTSAGCHGGDWQAIVEKGEGMFKGIGQIPDANPHFAHATNAYECGECHSLEGTSILMCDECHNFAAPEGWDTKDPRSTIYGHSETPMFIGDGVVSQTE